VSFDNLAERIEEQKVHIDCTDEKTRFGFKRRILKQQDKDTVKEHRNGVKEGMIPQRKILQYFKPKEGNTIND
jgi:hypothetical protein